MDSNTVKKSVRPRLPDWIRVKAHAGEGRNSIQNLVSSLGLHTVCQSAKCPNLGECWHKRTATFMYWVRPVRETADFAPSKEESQKHLMLKNLIILH